MLNIPIRYLKGVGPKREKSFKKLDISTIEDLIYYYPCRYQDRTIQTPIVNFEAGYFYSFKAQVLSKAEFKGFRRKHILKVLVSDDSASIVCVWFNQSYLSNYFEKGRELFFYGKAARYEGALQVTAPEFEIVDKDLKQGAKILSIYPLKDEFTQRYFREIIEQALKEYASKISDILPFDIRKKYDLINNIRALNNIHFPEDHKILEAAFKRLCFEEFFLFSIPLVLRRIIAKEKPGINHKIDDELTKKLMVNFGFELTADQKLALDEIRADMQSNFPMQRLLQGEVGSGKTVVAAIAASYAISGGYQVAFMCPTEILAWQHYNNFKKWFNWLDNNEVVFLTSTVKNKKNIHQLAKGGKAKIIIGTHALLSQDVVFKNLGLIVIDEQHKFGLLQRNVLSQKGFYSLSYWPDVLIMTATPIPRSLALTIYGDLDISTIRELPGNRLLPETVYFKDIDSQKAYEFLAGQIQSGRQAYIIYPIIEESLSLELKAAIAMYEKLRRDIFKQFTVGLIHGRLKDSQQKEIMDKFTSGQIQILVATSILEIGVDVPNATCMVLEHAERFGLSQLHQLRGRIARGQNQGYFILVTDPKTQDSISRISAIQETCDGFEIAQKDLEIRGPGEFFGIRQHGLSELKIADPLRQIDLLKAARLEAKKLLEKDPDLNTRQNYNLIKALEEKIPNYRQFNKIT